MAPVTAEKIPSTLSGRFTEEKEIDSIKKKEKQEAHMYLGVTVITDEQFNGHQGKISRCRRFLPVSAFFETLQNTS